MDLVKQNAKHIRVINEEMGDIRSCVNSMKPKIAKIETDVEWLKKFFFIIVTTSLGSAAAIIGAVIILLIQLPKML